jgi:uncharacterized protein (TIGR00369 family)
MMHATQIEATSRMPSSMLYLQQSIATVPFHQWLCPVVAEVDESSGRVVISLALRPEFRRDPDRPGVHGGIIAALIDIAGHAAVAAKLRRSAPTVDLRVDYVRLAAGARLLATAEPVRIGRNIGLVDIRVTDDEDTLVAVGRCVFSTQDRGS